MKGKGGATGKKPNVTHKVAQSNANLGEKKTTTAKGHTKATETKKSTTNKKEDEKQF